jgi:single-strand DNA-binding protein
MNKVILMGRTTKEPEIKYSNDHVIAVFSIAVDRRYKSKNEEAGVDFFNCVSFGKTAEFIEKYIGKGKKVVLSGRLQNDVYTNRDGKKVTNAKVYVDEIEFAESKKKEKTDDDPADKLPENPSNGFMHIPDDVDDEELPWG